MSSMWSRIWRPGSLPLLQGIQNGALESPRENFLSFLSETHNRMIIDGNFMEMFVGGKIRRGMLGDRWMITGAQGDGMTAEKDTMVTHVAWQVRSKVALAEWGINQHKFTTKAKTQMGLQHYPRGLAVRTRKVERTSDSGQKKQISNPRDIFIGRNTSTHEKATISSNNVYISLWPWVGKNSVRSVKSPQLLDIDIWNLDKQGNDTQG